MPNNTNVHVYAIIFWFWTSGRLNICVHNCNFTKFPFVRYDLSQELAIFFDKLLNLVQLVQAFLGRVCFCFFRVKIMFTLYRGQFLLLSPCRCQETKMLCKLQWHNALSYYYYCYEFFIKNIIFYTYKQSCVVCCMVIKD